MLKIENYCCGCASPGYPCMGSICPNRKVKVYYCDEFKKECDDEPFVIDGEHFCEKCFNRLNKSPAY